MKEVKIMENHLIKFDLLDWITPAKGIRYKKFKNGSNVIRLLEFSEGFLEEEYCPKGHACYVLEGCFNIEYTGKLETYAAGDVIYIPAGKEDKHKAIISKGERVLLLMYEIEHSIPDVTDYSI